VVVLLQARAAIRPPRREPLNVVRRGHDCRLSAKTRQRWEHEYDLERRGAA